MVGRQLQDNRHDRCYTVAMTSKLLEQAIAEVRKLPEARQDEAAQMLLGLVAQDPGSVSLNEAQLRDLQARLNDANEDRASEAEVAALYQRLGA